MEEKEGSDWKNRLATYEGVLHQLTESDNPPTQLIQQLQSDLPRYLADVNPNCLKVALTICQHYFEIVNKGYQSPSNSKQSHLQYPVNYSQIAKILIEKSFTTNKQTNSDIAADLLLQCLHYTSNSFLGSNFSPSNSNNVIEYIFDELSSKSPRIVRSMIHVLNSYMSSYANDSSKKSLPNVEINRIIDNLTHLLDNRDPNIRKEANSAINLGKSLLNGNNSNKKANGNKRTYSPSSSTTNSHSNDSNYQSLINQSNSTSKVHRQHSKSPSSPKYLSPTNLNNRYEDNSNDYRNSPDYANNNHANQQIQMKRKASSPSPSSISPTSATTGRQRSPSHKKKFNAQNASSLWSVWVSKATLALLQHSKWQNVIAGFNDLRSQYNDEAGNPSACAYGLATVFLNRTFTPKVMNTLMTEILFYMKEDTQNLTEDTIHALLHFFVDKITDKRLENYLFEVSDIICELASPSYVFNFLYPSLQAKNPMLPARICCYFSHCLQAFVDNQLNIEELSDRIKPLCTHSDPNVRKSAVDCVSILVSLYGESVLDDFKLILKPVQIASIKKNVLKGNQNNRPTNLIRHRRSSQSPSASSPRSNNNSNNGNSSPIKRTQSTSATTLTSHANNTLRKNGFLQQQKAKKLNHNRKSSYNEIDNDVNDFNEDVIIGDEYQIDDPNEDDIESFIPGRLLNSITKISNVSESHKAFEEIENILNRSLELRGPSSMLQGEFVPLFSSISVWLKIENKINSTIAYDISKILFKSFKLITPNDAPNISEVFLMDIFMLLNYKEKQIRKTILNVLNLLNSMIPDFITNIFIPIFPKVGQDGRKAAVLFLRSLKLKININDYLPFFVNCMTDKNEDFKEACSPLIRQFLKLQGASESVKEFINDFPPDKKKMILELLSSEKASPIYNSCFLQKPTQHKKEKREKKIDCLLPLKILNETEKIEALTDLIEHYGFRYFCINEVCNDDNVTSTPNFASADINDIYILSSLFLKAAESDFESLSLTLDIVLLWWAQLSLLIQEPQGFKAIFNFLNKLLKILNENYRKLDKFESTVILPTILECVGRPLFSNKLSNSVSKLRRVSNENVNFDEGNNDDNENKKIVEVQKKVFDLTPINFLLPILVQILGNVTSIYTIKADLNALIDILPKCDLNGHQNFDDIEKSNLIHEIVRTVTKIQNVLMKDANKNPDLLVSLQNFIDFLTNNNLIEKNYFANGQLNQQNKQFSRCSLSPTISTRLKSPSILVYQWIVDLSSQDNQITIQALKSISLQLKTDPTIFEPHLEALTLWLITSVHTYFSIDPPPSRLCKYIALCLLTLFNETSLKEVISQEFIQQLIYEILTHLSNGINESVLNQVLNALIIKLIDDFTMFSFIGLLSALNEFENKEHYTEKWIRLGLKCFEACGVRICEVKNEDNIKQSIFLINKTLMKHSVKELQSSAIGAKIVNVIKSYLKLVYERFSNVVNTKEVRKKLGNNSELMKLINDQ